MTPNSWAATLVEPKTARGPGHLLFRSSLLCSPQPVEWSSKNYNALMRIL